MLTAGDKAGRWRRGVVRIALVAALGMTGAALTAAHAQQKDPGAPYNVKCNDQGRDCAVDKGTYIGWRTYNGFCARCHGEGAVGSSFAPSLIDRINNNDMKFARFAAVVANGMTGQVGVMPGWKENPNVMKRINELWSFLRARSDGVLAPGRPDKLGEQGPGKSAPSNWE